MSSTSSPAAQGQGIVIFARLDSSRLPGKVLKPIGGRPMLGLIIDRMRRAAASGNVVVATSDRAVDDPIARFATDEGVHLFRGPCDDVAARAFQCAQANGFDRFVRISGDSPFIDPKLVDLVASAQVQSGADLATNTQVRTYPPGMSVEVVRTVAMRRLLAETDHADDREHVTRYFYRCPQGFRIVNCRAADSRYEGLRLVVDTPEDYARANWIADHLGDDLVSADIDAVARLARKALRHSPDERVGVR